MMPHGKSFLYGLSGTVKGRLGLAGEEMQTICPHVERIIASTNWLKDADFDTIHYVMRFGEEKDTSINTENGHATKNLRSQAKNRWHRFIRFFLIEISFDDSSRRNSYEYWTLSEQSTTCLQMCYYLTSLKLTPGEAGQSDARKSPIDREFET